LKPWDVMSALLLESGERWVDKAADFQLRDARAVIEGEQPSNFIGRPRGGSKTTDLGAIGSAWVLSADGPDRYYAAAADRDQARLLLDSVAGFARRSPELAAGLRVDQWKVTAPSTGATLEILVSDVGSSWGLRPAGIIIDELAWWPDVPSSHLLLDSLLSSAAKMPDCRVAVITSPSSPSHFAYRLRNHASEDPLWRLSETEGPVPWLALERIEEQRRRLSPAMFERLFMGRWVEADDALVTDELLQAALRHTGPLEARHGVKYVIGLDLGLKRDATAAMVCHKQGDEIVLDRKAVWRGSRIRPVKLDDVEAWLGETTRYYNNAEVVADPWQSVGLLQRLKGAGVRAEEFAFTAASVGKLAGALFNLLRDRRLALPDDDESLIDELAHVRLKETSPGVFRIDHDAGRHDDQAIALALAAHHLLREPEYGLPSSAPFNPFSGGVPVGTANRDWKLSPEMQSWWDSIGAPRPQLPFNPKEN
jgi:phage terminase large subunit-like protein